MLELSAPESTLPCSAVFTGVRESPLRLEDTKAGDELTDL